jgi:nicotinamidase/pyrazinamidase
LCSRTATRPFERTGLPGVLDEPGVQKVVVAGAATEMCVFQSALDVGRSGLEVVVRGDASATVDSENERIALDYLERVLGLEVVRPSE